MRVLLIGPQSEKGSIPPYLNVLTSALRVLGAQVDRLGTPRLPYDEITRTFWPTERILQTATALLYDIDLTSYDVISLHFGNLEIEQVLPAVWAKRRRPPVIYHVHSLDWSLFKTQRPDPPLRAAIDDSMQRMDGFVFFGGYGHDELTRRLNRHAPSVTTWLPTTIPPGTRTSTTAAISAALTTDTGPVGSLYGYAAPWKDPASLIGACQRTTTENKLILAGPLWDDPQQAGIDLSAETKTGVVHGATRVDVIAEYLGPQDRQAIAWGSDYGIFPYRPHPTFQGSGAIADYLAHGTPVLGTDVANMAELIGEAGLIVPSGDVEALADGLDRFAGDTALRRSLIAQARKRSWQFSASHHAMQCLRLYEDVIAERATF
ncbi:glycosyltransferase family 4 protein [Micromonosporaceae bacterium Da 78-11]